MNIVIKGQGDFYKLFHNILHPVDSENVIVHLFQAFLRPMDILILFKNYKIGNILSVLILLLVLFLSRFNNLTKMNQYEIDKCRWSSDMKKLGLSGIIVKKMIDNSNHNKPTLEVSGSGVVKGIQFTNELSGFYDFAMIGDSVRKEAGSLNILVIRNGEIMEKELSYGCEEEAKAN